MSFTTELLNNIKTVKLQAWRDRFLTILSRKRDIEMSLSKRKINVYMGMATMWVLAPILLEAVSLSSYIAFMP